MAVLRLVYFDTNNEERTVSVDKDIFTVGRSSENDLSVPDSRLSRDHLEIERAYGEFTARDVGSSNGTKHNGYDLNDAVVIKNGDEFDLGGGLLLRAIVEDEVKEASPEPDAETPSAAKKKAAPAAASSSSGSSSSLLTTLILVIPAAGIVLLLLVGGVFLLVSGSGKDDNDQAYSDRTDTDSDDDTTTTVSTPTPKKAESNDDAGSSDDPSDGGTTDGNDGTAASPTPAVETAESLAEKHGAEFLRAIAHNEPRAFLTGEQGRVVAQKIKSISSPTLADNIKSAKSNASQIKAIADAQNLKPQILAAAAIAKMGGGRGDIVQTAKTMAETLGVLRTQIGQEFGDDVLLTIAAYDQGAAGDTMKMRNMLQGLTGKYQVSIRTIRSIWFLKKNNLITDQQYDLALRFLAVGTVMQNPKAFNVNAEPVVF